MDDRHKSDIVQNAKKEKHGHLTLTLLGHEGKKKKIPLNGMHRPDSLQTLNSFPTRCEQERSTKLTLVTATKREIASLLAQ